MVLHRLAYMVTHTPAWPSWVRYCPYQFAKLEFAWELPMQTQCLDLSNWSNLPCSNETFTNASVLSRKAALEIVWLHYLLEHSYALDAAAFQGYSWCRWMSWSTVTGWLSTSQWHISAVFFKLIQSLHLFISFHRRLLHIPLLAVVLTLLHSCLSFQL